MSFMRIPGSQRFSPSTETLEPDTEENVIEQSEDVVRNFMYQRYQENHDNDETTPAVPELTMLTANPLSQASNVGRALAIIGDDINKRYKDEFNEMIQSLSVTDQTAYDVFANLAGKLFSDGINWGRISALLCFAYNLAMTKLKASAQHFANFITVIVKHCVKFIKEKIASWIASHGGWAAALTDVQSVNTLKVAGVVASCLLVVGIVVYFKK